MRPRFWSAQLQSWSTSFASSCHSEDCISSCYRWSYCAGLSHRSSSSGEDRTVLFFLCECVPCSQQGCYWPIAFALFCVVGNVVECSFHRFDAYGPCFGAKSHKADNTRKGNVVSVVELFRKNGRGGRWKGLELAIGNWQHLWV